MPREVGVSTNYSGTVDGVDPGREGADHVDDPVVTAVGLSFIALGA